MSFKFNIGNFDDSEEKTVINEEEKPEVTETKEENTEVIESRVDLNQLAIDLEDLDLGDTQAFINETIKDLGFDSMEALEAAGDGGVQIAKLLKKFNSKFDEVSSKAKTKYKELADLPVVKQAKALEKIQKEFEANNTEWQVDFFEVAEDTVNQLKTLSKEKVATVEKEIDKLVSDFLISRQVAGKKLINPYIALQSKIEKIVSGAIEKPKPATPKPSAPDKKIASLSGGTSSVTVKNEFSPPSGMPKKQAQMVNMFSGLINNLKEI